MAKKAKAWTVESEQLVLEENRRWGVTSHVGSDGGSPWEWYAEGGPLGPVEGVARTAAEARQRVEQALGLLPASPALLRQARQYQRACGWRAAR